MKIKFLTTLLVFLMFFQISALADFQLGTESDELVLGGECEPYERVTFVLLNSDAMSCSNAEETLEKYKYNVNNNIPMMNSEIFFFGTTNADSEGKWAFLLPMNGTDASGADMESADYSVNLTLITNTMQNEFIRYSSIAYRKSIIPVLKEKAAIDDGAKELTEAITRYIEYITDGEIYEKISDKTKVASYNVSLIKELDLTSEEAVKILRQGIDEAVLVQAVVEGIVTDFDEAMKIVDYDKSKLLGITDKGKEKVVELLRKGKNYSGVDEYKEMAEVQFCIQLFNYNQNQSGANLLKILKEINGVLNLDLSDVKDNSDGEYVAKQLSSKKCESVSDMQDELDLIIKNQKKDSGDKKSSGGGGGSASGSRLPLEGAYVASAPESVSDEYIQEHKYIYKDLNQAPWAADAVVYLSDKDIVNGYDDGSFRPLNTITRAEFTKLVVKTFFGDEKSEFTEPFEDVDDSDWFAEYVNIAYNRKIVSGDGFGKFNPEEPISRQDMAVIIYNAGAEFGLYADNTVVEKFYDDESISDYAREAVYCLKNQNIINGVGGNLFAPEDNANRASAVQILYSVMINYYK